MIEEHARAAETKSASKVPPRLGIVHLLICAVDNIGRGVPSTAPHHWRLKELVAQLRRMRLSPARVNMTMLLAQLQSDSRPVVLQALDLVLDRPPIFWTLKRVISAGIALAC